MDGWTWIINIQTERNALVNEGTPIRKNITLTGVKMTLIMDLRGSHTMLKDYQ